MNIFSKLLTKKENQSIQNPHKEKLESYCIENPIFKKDLAQELSDLEELILSEASTGQQKLEKGNNFEVFLERFFVYCGFHAGQTIKKNKRYDSGIDLILIKDDIKFVIQAKCFHPLKTYVNVKHITSFVNSCTDDDYKNAKLVFIATSYYEEGALATAQHYPNLELLNIEDLIALIAKAQPKLFSYAYLLKNIQLKPCNNPNCSGFQKNLFGDYGAYKQCSNCNQNTSSTYKKTASVK